MNFTWTIDEDTSHERRKSGNWGGVWWERARQGLRLANASDETREDSNEGISAQEMLKAVRKEERRSLYTKVSPTSYGNTKA